MKKTFILSLFYLLILNSFAFNSVKELDKTIKSFQEQFLKKPFEISNEYILTYEEFKYLATINPKNKPDEVAIKKDYETYYLQKVDLKIKSFNRDLLPIKSIISYDTVTYYERKGYNDELKIIEICFIMQKKPNSFLNKGSITRYKMKFIILNDQIKFTGQSSTQSLYHYNLGNLDIIRSQNKSILNSQYKGEIFDKAKFKCIPKFENEKWGLVSLNNELLVPCIYDEIKTFKNNYSLVTINGMYNLLDTTFKLVFKSNLPEIKFENNLYYILNEKNQFVIYPYVLKKNEFNDVMIRPEYLVDNYNFNITSNGIINDEINYKIESISDYNSKKHTSIFLIIDNKTKDTLSKHYNFPFINKHGKYIYGVKNDSTYLMTPKGELLFKSNLICNFNDYFVDVLDMEKRLFGLYIPENKLFIKPKYLCVLPIENKYFVVLRSNGKIGYLDKNGIELF